MNRFVSGALSCENPLLTDADYVHQRGAFRDRHFMTAILILDQYFRILHRMPLGPILGILPYDARLFVLGDHLMATFSGLSTHSGRTTGMYLAQLAYRGSEFQFTSMRRLTSARNAGLLTAHGSLWELNTVLPPHAISLTGPPRDAIQPYRLRPVEMDRRVWDAEWMASRMNDSFANHVSISPLRVPELGGLLALSHRRYPRLGFRYIFYVLDPTTLRILRHSKELSLPGSSRGREGEAVEFVTGALRRGHFVQLMYGVDDCSSAIAHLPIAFLDRLVLTMKPQYE